MKTITLVAIIAAIVVVGGACVGIPLSGVLNDMSGTQGNDPVQPTDPPVEPTPTETPTPTPTSTPMVSFSGGGAKSDSGSSSVVPPTQPENPAPSDPVCLHESGWTNTTSTTEGKHWKKCNLCNDEQEVDCEYDDVYTNPQNEWHEQTCLWCLGSVSEPCSFVAEDAYEILDAEKATHTKTCDTCGKSYTEECTIVETEDSKKLCTGCNFDYTSVVIASIEDGTTTAYYVTVSDAVNATEENQVVTLLSDMTNAENLPSDKTAVLNLDGKEAKLIYSKLEDIKIQNTGWIATSQIQVVIGGETKDVVLSSIPEGDLLTVVGCEIDGSLGIYEADGLRAFAMMVNGGDSFSGKTVKLMEDIDLENEPWTPISQTTTGKYFLGTFDGNEKEISNININNDDTDKNCATGLFGWLPEAGPTIKNVNVNGASVTGHHNVAVIAGYITGSTTIENCHVTSATVICTHATDDACGDKAGVIIGIIGAKTAKITGCSATESTVKAGRDAGQLVGSFTTGVLDENNNGCSATNVAVSATGDCTGANIRNELVGRIPDLLDDPEKKEIHIYTANGMKSFADMVNVKNNNLDDYTVILEDDIDLNNELWTPIGQTGATEFKGVFDGQNHVISNLKIVNTDESKDCSTGLFGWIESHGNEDITIKNVMVNTATVSGHHYVAVIAGYTEGSATIENCHVTGATVICTHANDDACGDKAGVIVGYAVPEVKIKGCTASSSSVTAGRDAGKIVGSLIGGQLEDCSSTDDVTFTVDPNCTHSNKGGNMGDLIGRTS